MRSHKCSQCERSVQELPVGTFVYLVKFNSEGLPVVVKQVIRCQDAAGFYFVEDVESPTGSRSQVSEIPLSYLLGVRIFKTQKDARAAAASFRDETLADCVRAVARLTVWEINEIEEYWEDGEEN